MPHDGLIELVRQCPDMAVDLARKVGGIKLPPDVSVSLASTDMSAAVPVQYLADMAVLASSLTTGEPLLAVVIEPQLRDRETKRYSWPVYVTTARQVNKCPEAVLLVLCPDPDEAAKCRTLIRTGHPGFDLAPIVIDADSTPGGDGSDNGAYLTVFAATMGAIDMATEAGARMVLNAIDATGANDANHFRMTAVILATASEGARQNLEKLMKTEYKKTFIDRVHDDGIAEGEAKGEAKALLKLLDARRVALSAEQRERIISCTDPVRLDSWFDRAITAATADEVFGD